MSPTGTILLTGGGGQTSTSIANVLASKGYPFLTASRRGQGEKGVKFDWGDKATWNNPFEADSNIRAVYIVKPPGLPNAFQSVKEFIDFAREKGVKRFVLLSELQTDRGDNATGTGLIWDYLATIDVEWAVLRPTWFIENFSAVLGKSIKQEGLIITATAGRKIGFVAVDDITPIAVAALTDEKSHNRDHRIFGPELLSYDDAAEIFTEVLGKEVKHQSLSEKERIEYYNKTLGLPESLARTLTGWEVNTANGVEEKAFNEEGGDHGVIKVRDFILANKQLWV